MKRNISRSGEILNNIQEGVRLNVSGNLFIVSTGFDYSRVDGVINNLAGRGEIQVFSESSIKRMRRYLRETTAKYTNMVTLTYPDGFGLNGNTAKNDLRRFCQELRRKRIAKNPKWSAFWFMEFTASGRIHFHIFTTDFYDYRWIAGTWFRIVGSGNEDHLRAGTRIEKIRLGRNGIASYAAKYANKLAQKQVPENFGWVGRFWGVYGYKERMAASTFFSPKQAGSPPLRRLRERLKQHINDGKMMEITSKMGDLPESVRVYRINSWDLSREIRDTVRFMEIYTALDEGREPNFEDEIPELYEMLMKEEDFSIDWDEYEAHKVHNLPKSLQTQAF